MKKFLALLLAALMVLGCANLSLAEDAAPLEVLTEFGDLTADDADYEPNPDYDKYTVISSTRGRGCMTSMFCLARSSLRRVST